ncbi:MAG TPA: hypothetical protein VFB59_03440 [Candidatus Saccharimonadales bacterium]|nr:hypothetical protein [Candidatus Saccharimonadales bacterium]
MTELRRLDTLPQSPDLSKNEPVGWQYILNPQVPNVCMDMTLARRVLELSGLSTMTITEFVGERTAMSAQYVGMTDDGTPMGVFMPRKSISLGSCEFAEDDPDKRHTTILVNRNEVGSRIADLRNDGYSIDVAWKSILGRGIADGIVFAAAQRRRKRVADRPSVPDMLKLITSSMSSKLLQFEYSD